MSFLKRLQNTTIQTKLVVPIVVLALVGMVAGSKVIEESLNKQIFTTQEGEIKNFSNKLFYILRSDYRTLFFEFGKDKELYASASQATQKESLNNLSQMLEGSGYEVYIFDQYDNFIPMTAATNDYQVLKERYNPHLIPEKIVFESDEKFLYRFDFLPWNWTVIIAKDQTMFHSIVKENKRLIFTTFFLLMLAVLALLFFVIYYVVQKPFQKVFAHLENIKKGDDVAPLTTDATQETKLLAHHINSMNEAIILREDALREEKSKNETILNTQPSIVIVSNANKIKYANKSFFDFFIRYANLEAFLNEHDCICEFFEKIDEKGFIYKKEDANWIEDVIDAKTPAKVLMKDKNKNDRVFNITANKIGNQEGLYVVNLTDITTIEKYKKQLELSREQLEIQLHTDELTKLPNRLSLNEAILNEGIVTLVLININDFKEVNDFYGVETGDKILYDFSQALKEFVKNSSYKVYKLSGDEYALFTVNAYRRDSVITFVNSLLEYFKTYDFYDLTSKRKINLTATAGAAINIEHSSAFVSADIALKTAKKKKRSFMTYKESLATKDEYASNIEWATRLKNAFLNDKIVPFFQPIYNNRTQKIEKYEALVRLIDENNTPVSPFFFLDVAKKSHQYMQLTETMIEKTFAYFKDKPYEFSINLSESDLTNFAVTSMILQKLQESSFGDRVVFEIVESENIDDYELIREFIKSAKTYGAKIAIDDFGAGFSNFQHVSQLNIDYIKIDGSLIQNILIDKNSETIVEAIATFAKRLEIKTIAEFVDSQAIQEKVISMGIDCTQGYLIGEPKEDIIT
jgi:diguanylate cyclase (GGDEF)-like protein